MKKKQTEIAKASHAAELDLNGFLLSCAVVNGQRLFSERSLATAFGIKGGGAYWKRKKVGDGHLPEYLSAKYLRGFISKELVQKLSNATDYISVSGGKAKGIDATALADICDVFISAQKELAKNNIDSEKIDLVAANAYKMIKGFAKVGIIALVDEATGYQEVRDKQELRTFLKKFLLEEKTKYVDAYPDEFFEVMFKMRGLTWSKANKGKNPQYFGHYINNYVYSRLGPEVLFSLRKLNPKNTKGYRGTKHYNYTSPEVGFPKLKEHLNVLVAFSKAAGYNWNSWVRMVERAFPKYNQDGSTILELPFDDQGQIS